MALDQFYITGHTLIPGHRVTFNVIWNQESGPNTTADNFPEAEAQARYPAAVYNYWQNRGGRGDATGYDHYHVFRVLNHHFDDFNVLYKVQWEGYPPTRPNCTWEPLDKLIDIAPEALRTYHHLVNQTQQQPTRRRGRRRRRTARPASVQAWAQQQRPMQESPRPARQTIDREASPEMTEDPAQTQGVDILVHRTLEDRSAQQTQLSAAPELNTTQGLAQGALERLMYQGPVPTLDGPQ